MDGSQGSDEEDSSGEQNEERGKSARENHCEIERRRRNKMTQYITELSELIPACSASQHKKLDKLTILRLAVTHMKSLQANAILVGGRPSFLTDQELKYLLLEAADGFLFVVHLSTGRFLYVSDTVTPVLGVMPSDWHSSTVYDQLHPEDVRKVEEQLSLSDGHRVLDLKTGTIKKESHQSQMRMGMGWRRSFICRFRVGPHELPVGESATNSHVARSRARATVTGPDGHHYVVVHVSGQLKNYMSSTSAGDSYSSGGMFGSSVDSSGVAPSGQSASPNNFCLVAVARLQVTSLPDSMTTGDGGRFTTRHTTAPASESLLTFADQKMTQVLGYMPQELLGRNFLNDFIAQDSQNSFILAWQEVLEEKSKREISVIAIAKSGNEVPLKITVEAFQNPYSEDVEFIICTHVNPMVYQSQAVDSYNGAKQQSRSDIVAGPSMAELPFGSYYPASIGQQTVQPENAPNWYSLHADQYAMASQVNANRWAFTGTSADGTSSARGDLIQPSTAFTAPYMPVGSEQFPMPNASLHNTDPNLPY